MINFNDYTNEYKAEHNSKWPYLINKREKLGLDHFKNHRAFIEYSIDMQDV